MSLFRASGAFGRASLTGLLGLLAAGVLALSTGACNTMSGLGQDVQAAGDAVSGAAEDVEDDAE